MKRNHRDYAMDEPIVEIDLHGLTVNAARERIGQAVRSAGKGVYKIRLIHGFNNGTLIKDMIYTDFRRSPSNRVLRVEPGWNLGITELVLRELYSSEP